MPIKPHTLASLDGVRGLACLLVVISHGSWISPIYANGEAGQLGVMLFFTLSGFLMAYHYMPGTVSLRYWLAFLVRRFLRVYPLYALIVFAVYILGHTVTNAYLAQFTDQRLVSHLLLGKTISVFWTVPLEIKFYVLFSVIAPFCLLWRPRYILLLLITLWAAVAWIGPEADKMNVWAYVPFFVAGMVVAQLYQQDAWVRINNRHWSMLALMCLAVIAFFGSTLFRPRGDELIELWSHSGFFSLLMGMLLFSIVRVQGTMRHVFANRMARFAGHISYSLYLVHFFIFVLCFYYPVERSIGHALLILPCTVTVAWLFYKTVEVPCHKLGIRLSSKIYKKVSAPQPDLVTDLPLDPASVTMK